MHLTFRGAPVTTDPSRMLMGVQPFVNAGERRACVAGVCRIRASRRLRTSRLADSIASVSSVVAITPLDIPCKGHLPPTHPLASLHPASIPQTVAHVAIHTVWGQTVGERNARQAHIACCTNGACALSRTDLKSASYALGNT
jgi:hypothetical protein